MRQNNRTLSRFMEELTWQLLTVLRLFVPLLILRWPITGLFASALIDLHDYNLLALRTDADYTAYQAWDKLLDIYYLSLLALIVCRWRESAAKWLGLGLYAYRLFGITLMELTGERQLLMLFPNVFENFVIFYLIYKAIKPERPLLRSFFTGVCIIAPLTALKLMQEYYLHVAEAQSGTLVFGYYDMNMFLWTMYLLLPLGLLVLATDAPRKLRAMLPLKLRLLARN